MRIVKLLVGSGFAATLATALARASTRVQVDGDSMRPTLEPGDHLLVHRTRRALPGHIVALHDPRDRTRVIVKRVAFVGDDGFIVVGDNRDRSTDSRHFGPVPPSLLVGVALYRYAPAQRMSGLLRRPVPCHQWSTASTPCSPPTSSRV